MPAGPARHCPAKLLTPVVTLTVSELGGGDALGDAWSGAGPLAGCMVEATGPVDKTAGWTAGSACLLLGLFVSPRPGAVSKAGV